MEPARLAVKTLITVLYLKELPTRINKAKIASSITDELDILGDDIGILPLPEDSPAEIPRIILTGKNHKCHISLERATLIAEPITNDSLESSVKDFVVLIKQFSEILLKQGFSISRIGFVVNGLIENNHSDFMSVNYLNGKKISAEGFNMHFLFNRQLPSAIVNKWVRLNYYAEKFAFDIDYNTLANVEIEFNNERIESFFYDIIGEFSKEVNVLLEYNAIQ